MTIDERLDRLTARHEAMAESLELLVATTHANSAAIKENAETIKENSKAIQELTGNIAMLARIAQSHESRIDRLEG